MRLRKPGSEPSRPLVSKLAGALAATSRGLVVELLRIVGEMVRIPAALFMRTAEAAGAAVLLAWERIWPVLVALWVVTAGLLRFAQAHLTPRRGTLAVAALTAVALAASQFADYRSVIIGTEAYTDVAGVAPPPEVDAASAGSAHAWLGLPLAAIALAIVAGCAAGRRRLARVLAPVGLAVVAISLAVDRPKGLDEGDAAIAYESAEAMLLEGFWAQLVAGAVLVALVPLLTSAAPAREARV